MKDKRQLFKNISAQFISISCSLGISFFLTSFLIRHLGVEVYGFFKLNPRNKEYFFAHEEWCQDVDYSAYRFLIKLKQAMNK
ncbi:hypothetical protein ACTNCI_00905 [Mitsuokella jalaludinii]|uniref:hypothetical protein n=1 Tax=Mitsuokella jalaludinii TaxID=187979 RepID=UPI003F8A989B